MFFQTHKGSLQVFRYCSIFKVLCASAVRLTACLFYHFRDNLSSTFWNYFRASRRSSSILHVRASVSKCFILSDVRLTVMYFSTAPDKKQAFSLHFFNEIRLLTFCPVFYIYYRHFLPYSSKSRVRSRIRILRSRREICTCVVCRSFAVSLWVLPP